MIFVSHDDIFLYRFTSFVALYLELFGLPISNTKSVVRPVLSIEWVGFIHSSDPTRGMTLSLSDKYKEKLAAAFKEFTDKPDIGVRRSVASFLRL
jgi:hypothetical protein